MELGSVIWLRSIITGPSGSAKNPETINAALHFNQLVEEARGDYFVVLCDDDEISSNYISELVGSLERSPEASVAISRQELMEKDGTVVRRSAESMPAVLSGEEFIKATWHDYAYGMEMVGTYLVRTEKLKNCGGYPDFCRSNGIDNAVLLKLILNSSVALNARCAFRWRIDEASYGWSVSTTEMATATKEFLHFLDTDPVIIKYAKARPEQWKESKGYLVRMTWETYLGRWRDIYKEKLSRVQWIWAAFSLPFIADYYKMIARHLFTDAKLFLKRKLQTVLPIKTSRLP